jgi:hypothetical protein
MEQRPEHQTPAAKKPMMFGEKILTSHACIS